MIYTFYTDTHSDLLNNWFISSLKEKDKLVIEKFDQDCPSGSFMSDGWTSTMLNKVDYIRDCISKNEIFYHLDCDIQFFDYFYDHYISKLEETGMDILAQHDGNNTLCCGFMLIRPSDKIKKLFDNVYETTKNKVYSNDQVALNYLIKNTDIKYDFMKNDVFSIWMTNGIRVWEPHHGVKNLPVNIKAHHSNFTIGIENKIKLMELVKQNVQNEYS